MKVDGQIWIDKKDPHNLKYHISNRDYVVDVSATYPLSNEVSLSKGSVVTLKDNKVVPAIFPDDINGIIGVISDISSQNISVTHSGYLVLEGNDLENLFPFKDDLDTTKNLWGNNTEGIGAPVYWFIGKTVKTENTESSPTYTYLDSSEESYKGKLTLQTPSGYKWNQKSVTDDSMNIAYDNLPIIATVSSYTLEGNKVVSLEMHVNFSKFDSSLEWNWPYLHHGNDPTGCGTLKEGSHKFRHGLFADNRKYSELSSYVNVMTADDSDNGSNNIVNVINQNFIKDPDRRTEISISTPEDMLYRISGTVHYKFDKEKSEKA